MIVVKRNPENAPKPAAAYSQVARIDLGSGALLYIAGQAALDESGAVIAPGDMAVQSNEVLKAIVALLRAEGAAPEHIVSIRGFLTDISRLPEYAAAWGEHIAGSRPTSTTVEVSKLFRPGMVVEVDVVAAIPA